MSRNRQPGPRTTLSLVSPDSAASGTSTRSSASVASNGGQRPARRRPACRAPTASASSMASSRQVPADSSWRAARALAVVARRLATTDDRPPGEGVAHLDLEVGGRRPARAERARRRWRPAAPGRGRQVGRAGSASDAGSGSTSTVRAAISARSAVRPVQYMASAARVGSDRRRSTWGMAGGGAPPPRSRRSALEHPHVLADRRSARPATRAGRRRPLEHPAVPAGQHHRARSPASRTWVRSGTGAGRRSAGDQAGRACARPVTLELGHVALGRGARSGPSQAATLGVGQLGAAADALGGQRGVGVVEDEALGGGHAPRPGGRGRRTTGSARSAAAGAGRSGTGRRRRGRGAAPATRPRRRRRG